MTVFVFLPQEFGTQILSTRLRVVPTPSMYLDHQLYSVHLSRKQMYVGLLPV
jgi:hypothetical protein